ncbi:MAG TPA: hypothetical protein VLT36_11735, partial [Candidatus Dormibacteraeota bacterium]|nr:hypothetical protein [Candidatus Dormibacteraeota bacterium]
LIVLFRFHFRMYSFNTNPSPLFPSFASVDPMRVHPCNSWLKILFRGFSFPQFKSGSPKS